MVKSFAEIEYPEDYQYASSKADFKPLRFYVEHLPHSVSLDIFLGYFSTSSLKLLSVEFAKFIADGGYVRIIMNHFLSDADRELFDSKGVGDILLFDEIIKNPTILRSIIENGGKHFFNCLKYLMRNGQLQIISVKYRGVEQTHVKKMILFDGKEYISTSGSVNFTASGLVRNSENLIVTAPWNSPIEKLRVESDLEEFAMVFNGLHPDYTIIDSSEMIVNLQAFSEEKQITELLQDGQHLLNLLNIERDRQVGVKPVIHEPLESNAYGMPCIPQGFELKNYQIQAHLNWVSNGKVGLFAMATGTGKTITAINCSIEEFKANQFYRVLVCVPGLPLIHQWKVELRKFNFHNQIDSLERNWKYNFEKKLLNIRLGVGNENFVAVLTYDALKSKEFKKFRKEFQRELGTILFIGDEVHNLGSPQLVKDLPVEFQYRIGLSATPNRKYDDEGTLIIYDYFKVVDSKFTIEYNMYNAIKNGVLSEFNYHPIFINLEQDEARAYLQKTKQLMKYIDSSTGRYRNDIDVVKQILIQRKAIIQKARNKLTALSRIINEIGVVEFKRVFIYVSPGYEYDYDENEGNEKTERLLIDEYTKLLGRKGLSVRQFTSKSVDREKIIEDFRTDRYDALVAVQCLDEGVDVKQTKYAIFCSSTGNPRQFIQRRGRVLRKYGDKIAVIYDLIVVPNTLRSVGIDSELALVERNIFRNELLRVIDFIALSKNMLSLVNGDFARRCEEFGVENLEELIFNEISSYE